MNRIHLLPEQVANQIAAGEVVERPASVVKELVENSLDAGATRILIEIGAGGRALIRVTDDGCGMNRDDALLCLERHATSKIRRAEDLDSIRSMGFRGEAIPSIASVSRFSLTTREHDETSGEATQILIQGGKIMDVKVAAGPPGTAIEVRQLFFNLPARRKFLRSEETERAHIQHYVGLMAMAHPRVALTLVHDGRVLWQFPAQRCETEADRIPALRERFRQVHGADADLLPIDFCADLDSHQSAFQEVGPEEASNLEVPDRPATKRDQLRLWGLIGKPGTSRSTRDSQHLFVNQRPIDNRGLNFALMEGYHTALMKGQYPVCCLFLEVDPSQVDVNIHPQKREVKFRDEMRVRRLVSQAVRESLHQFHQPAPAVALSPEVPSASPTRSVVSPNQSSFKLWSPATVGGGRADSSSPLVPVPEPEKGPVESSATPSRSAIGPSAVPVESTVQGLPRRTVADDVPTVAPPPEPLPLPRVRLRMVGVIGRLYVVFESDRGMVLMDQHAAHERVLFEQMLSRMERTEAGPSQKLLLPETVELSPRDAEFLRRHLDVLSRLGVGLREFGERTFLLDALPPFVKTGQPRQFIFELIDQLKAAGSQVNNLRLGEDVVAKTVCRHAVKANDALSPRELEQLAQDLRQCVMPYTCPHGRPTLIEMSWRELEKKFGRTG